MFIFSKQASLSMSAEFYFSYKERDLRDGIANLSERHNFVAG